MVVLNNEVMNIIYAYKHNLEYKIVMDQLKDKHIEDYLNRYYIRHFIDFA